MDPRLHEVRVRIAAGSGVAPEDLPLLGKLIEVLPDEARWRIATETVLHGTARLMLIDAVRLDEISRIIDPLQLEHHINFTGVDLAETYPDTDVNSDWIAVHGQIRSGMGSARSRRQDVSERCSPAY